MIGFLGITKLIMVIAVGLFLAALTAALVWSYGRYVFNLVWAPRVIQFESIKTADDEMSAYLLARAQELSRGVSLDALYEIKVPAVGDIFSTAGQFKIPDSAKFEIQGVDVPGVVRAVLKILPDGGYRVSVEPVKGVAGTAARLEWRSPGAEPRVWLLHATQYPDETADSAKSRMLDRVIYTLLYHLYYDPDGPSEWRDDIRSKPALDLKFPTARAVEAYYAGLQFLRSYLASSIADDLKAAEREFQRLNQEMPDFVDGLMLLGITYSERRNELAAIPIYERVVELLADALKKSSAGNTRLVKKSIQARLFRANSYRKLYRWDAVQRAIVALDALDDELSAAINSPQVKDSAAAAEAKYEFEKIRLAVLAEKANTIGYHLILLFRMNFIEALVQPSTPRAIKPDPIRSARLQKIALDLMHSPNDPAILARRDEAFKTEMAALHQVQRNVLAEATRSLASVRPPMPAGMSSGSGSAKLQDEARRAQETWDHERQRIQSLLLIAEGYGLFRLAQALDGSEVEFLRQCSEALDKLQRADTLQPNNYLALQNLGLIYGDPRYDPTGSQIDVARRFFTRSIDLKADDYFGYQQIALLAVRQVNASRVELADPKMISDGMTSASNSLKLRAGNWAVYLPLASLLAAQWSQESDETKRRPLVERIAALIADARKLNGNATRILSTDLQWWVVRLRGVSDEKKFETLKSGFETALGNVPASGYPRWEADKLSKAATALKAQVGALKFATRADLRWPD